jgi:alpha-glucosidase
VPNHTSSEHEWFRAALAAGPGSKERERYLFRDSPDGPPNNWSSVFGGPAWTQVEDGQWYLHLFDATQPDLNWRNPEVGDMFVDVLTFWLDRGVDGFRVDVAHGLFKEEGLRDQVVEEGAAPSSDSSEVAGGSSMVERTMRDEPMWDQPEVHDVYRRWHDVLAKYDGDRMLVAEAWTQSPESMARFIRPDEMSQAFNFSWLLADWSARAFEEVVTGTFASVAPVGGTPTWVLSNHDVVRHATRYGGGARGLARARAATLTMLGLPGSSYLYEGEELGLEQVDVAADFRQDPSWFRTGEPGRDGCRVPLPWSGDAAPYGFGPGAGQPWIPQPDGWADLTVEAQAADPASTLSFYRAALTARRGIVDAGDSVEMLDLGADVLAFRRGDLTVVLNCGATAVPLPAGEVLASSAPVDGELPGDTAVWLR